MKRYPKYNHSGIDWIGDIPEHWHTQLLKRSIKFEYGYSLASEDRKDGQVPVYGSNGVAGFHSIAITKSPCLIIGRKGSYGKVNWSAEPCFPIDTTYFVDENKTEHDLRWLYYILPNLGLDRFSRDTGVPGLNREDAYQNYLPIPPKPEQTAIAYYLNKKTAQIDDLIAKKQKLIDLLKEERTAVINQAVTRGLDPNVKLKPSGIDWLGDIPEHWEVKKLKYTARIFRGKFTHRPRNDEKLYGGSYPFIQTGEVAKASKFLTEYTQTLNEDGYKVTAEFPKGTLLMTIAANIGEVAILGIKACFPDSVVGFYPKDVLDNEYLFYKLKSLKEIFLSTSIINTQFNLNIDRISAISISYPPIIEQAAIVKHIEQQLFRIDKTIAKIEQEIELLHEYRTALISEVVTGKIKVI